MTLKDRAKTVLAPVIGNITGLEIKSGKGVYLTDHQDTPYLDFSSGLAVVSTGHCHPRVVSAIQHQAATLIHGCAGLVYYDPNVALAEQLGACLGSNLTQAFFCQSGTEAVEAALKLAKYVTQRSEILVFEGGFHGRTLGALSATTSNPTYHDRYHPLLPGITTFPFPDIYRNPWENKADNPDLSKGLDQLEALFSEKGDQFAAAMIEPITGEGGYHPAPAEFLSRLRDLCSRYGVQLIFDEIQTGVGRTGTFCRFHAVNTVPDIVVLSKGLASGLPLGAILSRPDVMKDWKKGAHGGTFGGNPVSCAAGIATLEVIQPILPDVKRLGELAMARLKETLSSHPKIGDIRGEGLMIGLEVVQDKTSREPDSEFVQQVMKQCLDQKLIIIPCGRYGHVIRLIPPLVIEEQDLNKGLDLFIQVLNDSK